MDERFRTPRVDWEDLHFFAALARHGSLSATARALRVNHTTVARRIAALEGSLRVKLFERWPTGYKLTAAGRHALMAADAMESAAGQLSQLKPAKVLSGLVRITATPSLAESFLIPRLLPLREQHPLLDVEINAQRELVSLNRHQSDIALRLGRPQQPELVARRVTGVVYHFYATPQWRDRIEKGATPCFIGFDEAGAEFPEAVWLARAFENAPLALRCNNQTGQIAAARAGFGIAMLPRFLANADQTLVEVSLSQEPPLREMWLLTRRDVQTTQRIRAVAEFLFDLFRRERPLFEGAARSPRAGA
jgi:DNA-binding transcriptional LysR family regulator